MTRIKRIPIDKLGKEIIDEVYNKYYYHSIDENDILSLMERVYLLTKQKLKEQGK